MVKIRDKAKFSKKITEEIINKYAEMVGDFNPLHIDEGYAKKTIFKGRIVHGMLTASLISTVLGTKLPGPGSIYLSQTIKFLKPARIGDTITAIVEVTNIKAVLDGVVVRAVSGLIEIYTGAGVVPVTGYCEAVAVKGYVVCAVEPYAAA